MHKFVSRRMYLILSVILCIALLAILSANVLPDQTWNVLMHIEKGYAAIVSRMTPVPTGADRIAEEAIIDEVVVHNLLPSSVEQPVFLRVDGKDPSNELMARFAPMGKTMNKASGAYFDQSKLGVPLDLSSGESGMLLSVDSIKWLFGDRVEVRASLTCGHLCGEGGLYELVKTKGHWTVETRKEHWVS
jgi:hypothetical protein